MSSDEPRRSVHVVAAALIDAAGRVLIAQRPEGKHLAGGWEFPGGKLEPGEARSAGLARELNEELGITIRAALARPLIRVRHAYPTRDVLLDMWVVRSFSGELRALDGQALRWVTLAELATVDLLPADEPIVAALRLPERLTESSSPYYTIGNLTTLRRPTVDAGAAREVPLQGVFCAGALEGRGAAQAGADFLVVLEPLADSEVAALCGSVAIPVFVRLKRLTQAWLLGASGINSIGLARNG